MKALKYLSIALTVFALVWSCSEDDFGSTEFVSSAEPPSNLTALFGITQDNTGSVTITPNGEGANYFDVYFGDETTEPVNVKQGESVEHVYKEGQYDVKLKGYGITGLTSEQTIPIEVSFKAPENLVVAIANDPAVSKQVNVIATADWALTYDVYFGEEGMDDPVSGNIGDLISYVYQEAGTYTIRVVAKSAAVETTEYTEEFEVTAIVQPIESAPAPPTRFDGDVISVFSGAYTNIAGVDYFPDWGQAGQGSSWAMFDLNGDEMLQYINLSYQGIQFAASEDVTGMEFIHLDVWTSDVTRMETSLISATNGEKPVWSDLTADQWTSIDIPISAFTDQGLTVADIHQLKFVGDPWAGGTVFIDNIYFWKEPAPASGLEGSWKLAPEEGALKVGPSPGSGEWWSSDAQVVIDRACFFDDEYILNVDGTFENVQQGETWIEPWQGMDPEACGVPVAPHDGSAAATFLYDANANTLKVSGTGAYIGLPKANNAGELPNVPVPESITYSIELKDNNNRMTVMIEAGSGVFWTYELVRNIPPVVGVWKIAPEAGALKVGPSAGSDQWWASTDQDVIDRACYFDDEYVISSDGSFSIVLQDETWVEDWQGADPVGCGTPVAPHDGMGDFTYSYDGSSGKISVNGEGAYIGIPKANNAGELPNVPVPASTVYDVTMLDANTMEVMIEAGSGVFWTYKLVK